MFVAILVNHAPFPPSFNVYHIYCNHDAENQHIHNQRDKNNYCPYVFTDECIYDYHGNDKYYCHEVSTKKERKAFHK